MQNELASPMEFYQESLDLDRFATVERVSRLAATSRTSTADSTIDAVMPIGGRALEFAVDHLSGVLAGAPVVFALAAVPQTNPSACLRTSRGGSRLHRGSSLPSRWRSGFNPMQGRWSSSGRGRGRLRVPVAAVNTAIADIGDTTACRSFRGWRSTRSRRAPLASPAQHRDSREFQAGRARAGVRSRRHRRKPVEGVGRADVHPAAQLRR